MDRSGDSFHPGTAAGPALVLRMPLSFYGGVEVATGKIIDRSSPDFGRSTAGTILVIPSGRGSSSSSSVLAELIRLGTGPLGIILARQDPIMLIGCLVAEKLYGIRVPIMICALGGIGDDDIVRIDCAVDGMARLSSGSALSRPGSPP